MAEKLCSECNFVFSSQISYNIHLKTCKDNVNYDPKNKYFCPSCCRQFRIFDNLKRHEEIFDRMDSNKDKVLTRDERKIFWESQEKSYKNKSRDGEKRGFWESDDNKYKR